MTAYILKTSFIVACLSFVSLSGVEAQNYKRAYKLLEKSDYEKADEIFNEILTENANNVSAHFGLALLYSNENFSKKDYLVAWEHADFANANKNKLAEDELEVLTEYFINTEERRSSRPVKKKMDLALELVLDKLIRQIRESNDVEFAKKVLEKFPDFEYYQNTVHIRNYLEYRAVEKQNTVDGYVRFISEFPDAAQVPLAIEKRNALIFEDVKKKNTLSSYNEFIYKYPNSKFNSEAVKLRNKIAFNNAKQKNTVEAIESFIINYPGALEVLDAKIIQKQLIYERAKNIRTLDAFNNFIRQYPEGAQYVDIFNLKSKELGQKLLQRNKYPSQSFQWARVFDNDKKFDEAYDVEIDKSTGEIFLACNTYEDSSKMMNAWVLGLKNNGDMAWNKQIGENFNDKVKNVKLIGNELYFTGYTRGLNDTIMGEPWVFKLLKNGIKIWNRTYDISSFEAFDMTGDAEILFGSSYLEDSLQKYYLTKLNSNLKRLWKREYSNNGIITSLSVTENGQITAGGGKWLFNLDNNGYLLWEDYISDNDSLVLITSNMNYVGIAGVRDSLSLFMSLYDIAGKKLWDKAFIFEDGIELSSLELDNNNNIYFVGTSAFDGVLIKLDIQGNIKDNIMFGTENKISFQGLTSSLDGSVYIVANESINERDADVVLLKYFP